MKLKVWVKHFQGIVREKVKDHTRSKLWGKVRKEHLKLNSKCEACGTQKKLQVHHIKPFHLHPELELEPTNLITLCMNEQMDCHLLIGHGDDWQSYNPFVVDDIKKLRIDIDDRNLIVEAAKQRRIKF